MKIITNTVSLHSLTPLEKLLKRFYYQADMTSFPHGFFLGGGPKYGTIQCKILGDSNSNSKNHKRLTNLTILNFQTYIAKKVLKLKGKLEKPAVIVKKDQYPYDINA